MPANRRIERAIAEALESRHMLAVGGGWTDGGLLGEYYNNATFTAPASFVRRDVRLNFDWGDYMKPGGSISAGLRDVGTNQYSIRWTGKVLPKFSETYTFIEHADDTFKLEIKPTGSSTWTTVIDQPTFVGADRTGTYTMTAGQQYDVRVSFAEFNGSAHVRLRWSSPSTPEEVIDTVNEVGLNADNLWSQAFTDIVKGARNTWVNITASQMDSNGWPMADGQLYYQESLNQGLDVDPLMRGTIHFSFNGRATLDIIGNSIRTSITSSYDPATNTTTGTFLTAEKGANASTFHFKDTDRDGDYGADGLPDHDGITNLKLIKPSAPDATTSLNPEKLFHPLMIDALMNHTTALRVHLNNANQESAWSDRTLPTYFNQSKGKATNRVYSGAGTKDNGASWEHKIMLANETGRDLYINLPMLVTGWSPADTTSYVYKLAQLIKYGSDANGNPYSSPQANPAYPPLNPNLRVYVELSNEYWNYGGDGYRQVYDLDAVVRASVDEYLAGSSTDPLARGEDYPIFNYDNLATTKDANGSYTNLPTWRKRLMILRVIQISNIFRNVFGDANMPGTSTNPRIRPWYMWQYENGNATASVPLGFVENYFANADGINHVSVARPVNYYIWGGGGASYYGSGNEHGVTDQIQNPSFETPVLANGYTQAPADSGWTFTGTAGIARDAGAGDDIPPAQQGSQMAYITGTGTMEQTFTLPATHTSNVYAFNFRSVQRTTTGGAVNTQRFQVSVDGVPVNYQSYSQWEVGYKPVAYTASNPWYANVVSWAKSTYYSTLTFVGDPGSTHTVKFVGVGAADQTAFIEDVRLSSVDAIFDGGMPSGGAFANGQTPSGVYLDRLKTQANWAVTHGLAYTTYEGGWALGGDNGGSPLQNHAKYSDTRAGTVNRNAMQFFTKAGGFLTTYGSYRQWPSWTEPLKTEGLLNIDGITLMQGHSLFLSELPNPVENGFSLASVQTLTWANKNLSVGIPVEGTIEKGDWVSWNLIAPAAGQYNLALDAPTGGTLELVLDGKKIDSFSSASSITRPPTNITLPPGLHSIRIRGTGGSFKMNTLTVRPGPGAAAGAALAVYDGTGMVYTDSAMAPDAVAANVSASNITLGPGMQILSPTTLKDGLYAKPADVVSPTTFDQAIAGNDYMPFTVTAAAGRTLSLSKLSLNLWRLNNLSFNVGLRYSTDGTSFTTVGQYDYTASPTGMTDFDLSSITALQNASGTVTFRVYFWNYGNNGIIAIGNKVGNDAVLYGTTSAAAAATIFSDDFNVAVAPVSLHGSAPDVRPGGETWVTQNNASKWFLNSSEFQIVSGGTANTAYLPYSATSGNIYELSAKVRFASNGGSTPSNLPLMLGFTSSASPSVTSHLGSESKAPIIMLRQNGMAQAKALAADLPGGVNIGSANVTSFNTLRLVLNTTGSSWVLDAFINNIQLDLNGSAAGSSYTYANMTGVQANTVALSNYGSSTTDGVFDDFLFRTISA